MKLIDIVNAVEALQNLSAQEGMNAKASYLLLKNIKAVEEEMQTYRSALSKLIHKYADKDENNQLVIENDQYHFNKENYPLFVKELENLGETEVEITIHKLSIEEFADIKISANTLSKLEFLIKE